MILPSIYLKLLITTQQLTLLNFLIDLFTMPHNLTTIHLDARWIGIHGIGRFASILDQHLKLPHLQITGQPSSAVDPLRLWLTMRRLPAHTGVFSPGYNAPLFITRPFIFTIHDLNHIDRPENSSFLKRLYYRLIVRRAARQAFRVITVSEFSRSRIIAWASLDPDHVINVGNGVDSSYHQGASAFAPGYPYLLCVGNRKGHKNEARVVEAFAKAEISQDIRLIFTGNPSNELDHLGRTFSITERLVFLGQIPEAELPGLYRGSLALLFPSLYEGFGLPIIEAMACGTPVLTANTTALPEIAGDAALLVNPLSVEEIKEGIEQLCCNLKLRERLRRRGLIRSTQFRWEKVVERVKSTLSQMNTINSYHNIQINQNQHQDT